MFFSDGGVVYILLWAGRNAAVEAACCSTMPHPIFPLPPISDPSNIQTLGEHIALGVDIRARCTSTGCNHNVPLKLVLLARYLGSRHGARPEHLKPYFYCPDCRSAGLSDENVAFSYYACTAPHTLLNDEGEGADSQRTAA
ncbi:hypothetical protein [Mesorhizobium sp. GR13]|nr:hypothetical protein [Mesorhizobium sp. GR13]